MRGRVRGVCAAGRWPSRERELAHVRRTAGFASDRSIAKHRRRSAGDHEQEIATSPSPPNDIEKPLPVAVEIYREFMRLRAVARVERHTAVVACRPALPDLSRALVHVALAL